MDTKSVTTYNFLAKLEMQDGSLATWPFQVMAFSQGKAKKILEDYLSHPEITGLRYRVCVGLEPQPANELIVESSYFKNEIYAKFE